MKSERRIAPIAIIFSLLLASAVMTSCNTTEGDTDTTAAVTVETTEGGASATEADATSTSAYDTVEDGTSVADTTAADTLSADVTSSDVTSDGTSANAPGDTSEPDVTLAPDETGSTSEDETVNPEESTTAGSSEETAPKYSEGMIYTKTDDKQGYILVDMGDCTDTDVIIPAEYDGLPVVNIGDRAFYDKKEILSVTIPDSVHVIGSQAFHLCQNLKKVNIPSSVTVIDNYAFDMCVKLESVSIPEGVRYIGVGIFKGCLALGSIEVSEENTEYYSDGNCVMRSKDKILIAGCKASVIPDGVKGINAEAFINLYTLKKISIPASVESIGNGAFSGCATLAKIDFKGTVEQWNKVTKGSEWDKSMPATYTVKCSDGNA